MDGRTDERNHSSVTISPPQWNAQGKNAGKSGVQLTQANWNSATLWVKEIPLSDHQIKMPYLYSYAMPPTVIRLNYPIKIAVACSSWQCLYHCVKVYPIKFVVPLLIMTMPPTVIRFIQSNLSYLYSSRQCLQLQYELSNQICRTFAHYENASHCNMDYPIKFAVPLLIMTMPPTVIRFIQSNLSYLYSSRQCLQLQYGLSNQICRTFTHHDDASHCDDYDGDELGDRKQILNFGG